MCSNNIQTNFSDCKPCVFLDRDGVINVDTGYPYRKEDLQLIDGVGAAIARLNALNYLVVVVTNQSGVARGFFDEKAVHQFHQYIQYELKQVNAHIDAFYICPYHPQAVIETYRQDHPDRKPRAGMIERAIHEWQIDRQKSFLIGDKQTDIEAAAKARIKGYLFQGDNLDDFIKNILKFSPMVLC